MKPLCIRGIADHENTKMKGKEVWAVIGDTEFGPTLYLTSEKNQAYKEACDCIAEALEGSYDKYYAKWGETSVHEDVKEFFDIYGQREMYEKAYYIAANMDSVYEHLGDQMWSVAEEGIH